MRLQELVRVLRAHDLVVQAPPEDTALTALTVDSREVRPGGRSTKPAGAPLYTRRDARNSQGGYTSAKRDRVCGALAVSFFIAGIIDLRPEFKQGVHERNYERFNFRRVAANSTGYSYIRRFPGGC